MVFVLAEFALVKVRSTRLEELVEAGGKLAPKAKEALHVVAARRFLWATQLGITLASLALGWIGEPAFAGIFERVFAAGGFMSSAAAHGASATAAFLLISGIHIIVGELTFKSIAIQHAERSALFVARPLRIFHRIFAIPLTLMNGASRAVLRLIRIKPASEVEVTYTEEELRSILGASAGARRLLLPHHLLLLENAFDFGELRLKELMVPLESTTCLDASRPWPENAAVMAQKRLSRYPLVDGPKGKVIGLVHVKTILMDLLSGRTPDLRRDMIKMPRAPQELLLEAALRKLQKSGEHMGIAVNEEGVPVGMFTLEDIVEELIGDIKDEFEPSRDVSIADVLRPGAIVLDPELEDRIALVERLVRLACEGAMVDTGLAIDAVLRREKAVPTSVAGSVAVPRARACRACASRAPRSRACAKA